MSDSTQGPENIAWCSECWARFHYDPSVSPATFPASLGGDSFLKQPLCLHNGFLSLPDKEEHAPDASELCSLVIPLRNPGWLMMPQHRSECSSAQNPSSSASSFHPIFQQESLLLYPRTSPCRQLLFT